MDSPSENDFSKSQFLPSAYGSDILGEHILVPLNPFIVIDIAFFPLAKLTSVHNAASITFFHRNYHMETFMVNHSSNCIERAIFGIVTLTDADQVEILSCQGIFSHGMEAKASYPVAPGNSASEFPIEISFVHRR
jgi:hypothetical protein